ncbi:MAG: SCP2 sterol-binding domain-containing protein [Acidiferrobacterales bacterium]|nr:SCP2 sterol-binding domain-containing protein [Acidiferrobacterales bacterium]
MLIELFEIACNHALEHDPQTQRRLQELHGKSMTLHVKTVQQSLTVSPCPEGLELSNKNPDTVDVTLSTTLAAMIKISRDGMDDADLQPGDLEISGDPIIGQRFATIITNLDINWEALLAEQIGESPARVVSIAAVQTRDFAQQSRSQLHSRFIHFIKDELEITAEKTDVDEFLDDVDTLKADSERMAARIKRLQTLKS